MFPGHCFRVTVRRDCRSPHELVKQVPSGAVALAGFMVFLPLKMMFRAAAEPAIQRYSRGENFCMSEHQLSIFNISRLGEKVKRNETKV
nr:MAG TPA: hypothetical protein [Caudoviricetes sp.]